MNRTTIIMAKWLAGGALLFSSVNAFADYKKGDIVDLTPTLQGTVLKDQQENTSSVSVEIRQNPDNKPSGAVEIKYLYTVNSQTFAVESMANSAFYNNKEITSVTINNAGLTTIPNNAFGKCTKLTKCDLSNIRYVNDQAFMDATALKEAIMPDVWHIGNQAFAYCNSLTTVEVGPECRIIGGMAFGLCKDLKEAKLHYGLTEIGVNNFTGSLALADFVLPYTVTNINKDLTSTSTLSRLFLLSPSFKEWIKTSDQNGLPLGYSLLKHSGLQEIYCIDELVEDVNNLLSQYKGSANFTTLEKAKSVSELVEVIPVGNGKFKIVKHNGDIPFVEVCISSYNGKLEDAQSFQRIFPDKDGVYSTEDGKAQIIYTVDKINELRYVVEIAEPNKYPVTDDQVVKMYGDIFPGSYDWTVKDMTKENGLWVLKDVKVKSGNFGFRVMENAEGTDWTWVSSAAEDSTVVLDAVNEGMKEGKNWYISKGTYTFTFNPGMYELTVTGTPDSAEDPAPKWEYTLYGNILGGDWKDTDLTETDGIWSVTLEDIKGGLFFIHQFDTANEKMGVIIKGESENGNVVPVVFKSDMKAVTANGGQWKIDAGSYTFNFDPSDMTLNVTKVGEENPEPAPESDYYLVGALPGWAPTEDYKFTKGENGEYTFDLEKLTGEFKITDGDKEIWYGADKEMAIELDKPYVCSTAADAGNLSFSEPVLNAKFTFVPETNTLTITGTLQEVEHDYFYTMCGAFTKDGDWKEYPMTLSDTDRWTLTLDEGFVVFQIREYDKGVDAEKVNRYIKSATDGIVDKSGTYAATAKDGVDWTSELTGKCIYTFNPDSSNLTIDGTSGISAIEAEEGEAIYFNLQGQRIDNPDKGIFIRVVNGKTRKVVK